MVTKDRGASAETWRNFFANVDWVGKIKGYHDELYDPTEWINGKEIKIFKMPNINDEAILYVEAGLKDLINQIGLDFKVNYYGAHESAIKQVKQSISSKGGIDGDKLSLILASEQYRIPKYGGRPHADVIITDLPFSEKPQDWGMSEFRLGYIILTLPGARQKSFDFIRKITKHEAGHLFGFFEHHDSTIVKGYNNVKDCNMLWKASTNYTCEKCADAIAYFWKGLESRKDKRFFK